MPTSKAKKQRFCPGCQTEARITAVFCRICGMRLPSMETHLQAENGSSITERHTHSGLCSACEFKNMPGEIFCEGCGVQLPPIASTPPSLPLRFSG